MAKTLRDVADEIHAIGKVLDSGCHPLTLEQEREFGRQLKYLVSYLHAFARATEPVERVALPDDGLTTGTRYACGCYEDPYCSRCCVLHRDTPFHA